MDTTETYIKMCDCSEIQGQWTAPPYDHDFCYNNKDNYVTYGRNISADTVDDYTWLPRQDQIQEMLWGKNFKNPIYLSKLFQEFHDKWLWLDFDTFEQLWLAFYMYEKHGKIWGGKKWLKQ